MSTALLTKKRWEKLYTTLQSDLNRIPESVHLCAKPSPVALHLVAVERGLVHGHVQDSCITFVVFHPINDLTVSGHIALEAAIDDVSCHAVTSDTPRCAVCRSRLPGTGHSIVA